MGTYTTNYNLFMPSIGEQGWGMLVNENFSIIDITMSGLNTRVGTLETEADAVEERVDNIENKVGNGAYVDNISIPIYAKLVLNDEGLGWVTNNGDYNNLPGFVFTNPDDTYTVTFTLNRPNTNTHSATVYAKNIVTGTNRTLGTLTNGYNNEANKTKTFTLKRIEAYYWGSTSGSMSVSGTTKIYLGKPY